MRARLAGCRWWLLLLGKDIWGSLTRRACLPSGENVTAKIHLWQLPECRAGCLPLNSCFHYFSSHV